MSTNIIFTTEFYSARYRTAYQPLIHQFNIMAN